MHNKYDTRVSLLVYTKIKEITNKFNHTIPTQGSIVNWLRDIFDIYVWIQPAISPTNTIIFEGCIASELLVSEEIVMDASVTSWEEVLENCISDALDYLILNDKHDFIIHKKYIAS